MGKDNKWLILGGLAVAGAVGLYMTQKCGILYPIFKQQCNAQEAKAQGLPIEAITDEYVAQRKANFVGGRGGLL